MARRSWGTDSGSPASSVVDISAYRRIHGLSGAKTVLYINDPSRRSCTLSGIPDIRVLDVRNMEDLASRMLTGNIDLVLLESDLGWADPVRLAKILSDISQTPIVLVCEPEKSRKTASLVKRAYSAGVSDTLYAPICADELRETMEVLTKFQTA